VDLYSYVNCVIRYGQRERRRIVIAVLVIVVVALAAGGVGPVPLLGAIGALVALIETLPRILSGRSTPPAATH
jgi:hypothetical protein